MIPCRLQIEYYIYIRERKITMTTCTNPNCRHRTKRKLRPLVISIIPRQTQNNDSANNNKPLRAEQITHMFKTHPSLAAHFEPPTFSPGVPSRELRNRLKLLDHARDAGLIPDVEWKAIYRAVKEQSSASSANDDDDADQHDNMNTTTTKLSDIEVQYWGEAGSENKHNPINAFKYLATEILIEPPSSEGITTNTSNNETDQQQNGTVANENGKKKHKKKHWLEYKTTSLVPISPDRCGSPEDIALPYSMELYRKAKTLNRDRSVLGCTLAHLIAMKTLVGGEERGNQDATLDTEEDATGFDFILEDNVRAFVGLENDGDDGSSCECANRIWDIIEASKSAPQQCHMRYFGWLGSLPNISWVYNNHIPRSALSNCTSQNECDGRMALFPFPTANDFELDDIAASGQESRRRSNETMEEDDEEEDVNDGKPRFTTPGGSQAVWGAFAYTISRGAYHSLLTQLQNDVGSLVWKGKRMRCYHAKPIDKVLPRHIKFAFGPESIHLPSKVAFVRCPMLGSLLHPQWEEGFCSSTELQHQLSTTGCDDGSNVWDSVLLMGEEEQLVEYRKTTGKWIQKGDLKRLLMDEKEPLNGYSGRSGSRTNRLATSTVIPLSVIAVLGLFISLTSECRLGASLLPRGAAVVDAFTSHTPINRRGERPTVLPVAVSDDDAIVEERVKRKLGNVPIISRKIPIEINDQASGEDKRLDITVWEMDQPSDLIQEWWSIDEAERAARVGDPFGVVMWPGSILASREMMQQHYSSPLKSPIANATVLVLGAGTGVEAQTAALLGAKKVIATDINPLTLKLLEYGAKQHDEEIGDAFECLYFDLFSSDPLPPCDIVVAADVLYNADLAKQVGLRLHEAIVRSFDEGLPPTKVIITDSQKFHGTNFLEEVNELKELNAMFKEDNWKVLKWEKHQLENVCGSGVLVDEDQVYDVEVRMICWGWQW